MGTSDAGGMQLTYRGTNLMRAEHRRPLVADARQGRRYGWAIKVTTAVKTDSVIVAVVRNDDQLRPLEILKIDGDAFDSFLLAPIRVECNVESCGPPNCFQVSVLQFWWLGHWRLRCS